jgi:hypothetical protein
VEELYSAFPVMDKIKIAIIIVSVYTNFLFITFTPALYKLKELFILFSEKIWKLLKKNEGT